MNGPLGAFVLGLAAALAAYGSARASEAGLPENLAQTLREIVPEYLSDTRYFAKMIDLDGDARPEIIAHLAGPMVCGTGGCDTLVLAHDAEGMKLVTQIGPARPPILVGETTSHGWRDLIVRVSGGGVLPGYDAILHFDGRSYPENPTVAPAERLESPVPGTVAIEPFESFTEGRLLWGGAE